MSVPELRIRCANTAEINPDGDFVLYWMTANRRRGWNFSLQRAVDYSTKRQKPLLILEALRCEYPWATDRVHQFVIQGMAANLQAFENTNATYYPYLEPHADAGRGLLESLAKRSCVVITDDFPCFFIPQMIANVAERLSVKLEAIDSNGILPLRATDRVFSRAHDFRRFLHKNLGPHLEAFPEPQPLDSLSIPKLSQLPEGILEKWPAADVTAISDQLSQLKDFPINHAVAGTETEGGHKAAELKLTAFRTKKVLNYADDRNQPEKDATSGFSPYLHFGHLSAHQIFTELMRDEEWTQSDLSEKPSGSRNGWWGCSPMLEAFLDELITWRELGYNMCWQRSDYDQYESLPDWAQQTLQDHASDIRPHIYSQEQFEDAATHNALWNAAQTQLVQDGRIHNYLRMLWGKKILHWSESPQVALQTMIELNNKYALDGRNPNSYSGIFWVLGRYDRAWGPEREVFGKIRYMTCDNTARKVKVKNYINEYSTSAGA